MKLLKSKLESLTSSMPTDSPMPSPDINAPSPTTSSISIEDLNIPNLNYEHNIVNSGEYNIMNSSLENSNNVNNITDVYVPTTVSNIKTYITTESFNTVQGMFILSI